MVVSKSVKKKACYEAFLFNMSFEVQMRQEKKPAIIIMQSLFNYACLKIYKCLNYTKMSYVGAVSLDILPAAWKMSSYI